MSADPVGAEDTGGGACDDTDSGATTGDPHDDQPPNNRMCAHGATVAHAHTRPSIGRSACAENGNVPRQGSRGTVTGG